MLVYYFGDHVYSVKHAHGGEIISLGSSLTAFCRLLSATADLTSRVPGTPHARRRPPPVHFLTYAAVIGRP